MNFTSQEYSAKNAENPPGNTGKKRNKFFHRIDAARANPEKISSAMIAKQLMTVYILHRIGFYQIEDEKNE